MTQFNDTKRAQLCVLPLEVALYQACINQRGAMAAIAAVYGHNANTFSLKVNPQRSTHHLNANEIENVIEYTRDPRILDSVCSAYSNDETTAHWFEVPTQGGHVDGEMLDHFGDVAAKLGILGKTLFSALGDNKIDEDELSSLEKCVRELASSGQAILARAAKMRGEE